MESRLDRQSFLGVRNSEATLARGAVGIVGLGGGGSHIVQRLGHLGIGHFRIYDQRIAVDDEGTNLNRLIRTTEEDVQSRTEKTWIAARLIRGINGAADVKLRTEHWQSNPDLLLECDVIFGCVDSFADRRELQAFARSSLHRISTSEWTCTRSKDTTRLPAK